eukprot:364889-Chlamydomonas_euryale.AAC.8
MASVMASSVMASFRDGRVWHQKLEAGPIQWLGVAVVKSIIVMPNVVTSLYISITRFRWIAPISARKSVTDVTSGITPCLCSIMPVKEEY